MIRRIKKLLAIIVLLGLVSGSAVVDQALARKERYAGTILAYGDSLTAGHGVERSEAYPAQLERTLQSSGYPWEVINAGVRGETTEGALMRVKGLLKIKPDIVILETGVNDYVQGDLRNTRRNIEQIVRTFQDNHVVVILAGMRSMNGYPRSEAFEKIYPAIARKYDLILVPSFLDRVAGNRALNIADGIHPTAQGYQLITNMLVPYVEKAIQQRTKITIPSSTPRP